MDLSQWSMVQWTALIGILVIIVFLSSSKQRRFGVVITVMILCFIASQRTSIGDTRAYVNGYFLHAAENLAELRAAIAINPIRAGFLSINWFLHVLLGTNTSLYLFVMAFFIIYPIISRANEYTNDLSFSLILFILSGMYITALNGMRQYLAAALFMLGLRWYEKGRRIRTILVILFLMTIHQSAFILIPFIFLPTDRPWGRPTQFLLGFGIVAYILYPLIAPIISTLLADSAEYGQYSEVIVSHSSGANIFRALVKLVPIVLGYLQRNKINGYKNYGLVLNGAILDFEFMLLATVQSWIIARFCIYFDVFSLILLLWSLNALEDKNKLFVKAGCFVLYFIFFAYDMMSMGLV